MISVRLNLTLFCAFLTRNSTLTSIYCITIITNPSGNLTCYHANDQWVVFGNSKSCRRLLSEDMSVLFIRLNSPNCFNIFSLQTFNSSHSSDPQTEIKKLMNAHILVKFSPFFFLLCSAVSFLDAVPGMKTHSDSEGRVCRHGDAIGTSLWTIV